MKGDISRDTFQAARNIRRVVAQQGRPWLDADWNEQVSVLLYRLETLAADMFGEHAAINDGFAIEAIGQEPTKKPFTFAVRRGRYYLHGLMCENHDPSEVTLETHDAKPYFVYLHAWEQYVSGAEESAIVEPALNGVETCGRTIVRWCLESREADSMNVQWEQFRQKQDLELLGATLKLKARRVVDDRGPARLQGQSGYSAMGNVLYRVEVHDAGKNPSFKWAPNNASALTPVSREGADLKCHGAGDLDAAFQPDGWVEVHRSPGRAQRESAGTLLRISAIDREARTLQVSGALPAGDRLFARPWTGHEPVKAGSFQPLDAGLEISFDTGSSRSLRVGQYWLIALRTDGGGQVYWPKRNDRVYEWVALDDAALGKIGVAARETDASAHRSRIADTADIPYRRRHYYGPLAVIQFEQNGDLDSKNIQDRRHVPKQP